MPQSKLIETITTFNVNGIDIEIITQYNPNELPDTLFAFLAEGVGVNQGIPYTEGDLVIVMKDGRYPSFIDFNFDSNGNLLVTSDDASQYDFDSEGNLIYIE